MIKELFTEEIIRDLYGKIIQDYKPYIISAVEEWYQTNEQEIIKAKREDDYLLAEKLTVKLERIVDENFNLPYVVKTYLALSFLLAPPSFRSNIVVSTNNYYLALYSIALAHASHKIEEINA